MKKIYFLVGIMLFSWTNAQVGKVGINTVEPVGTLDINGNLMVRTVPAAQAAASYNYLVVDGTTNEVQKVSAFSAPFVNTTMAKAVETDGISLLDGELYPGWKRVNFGENHVPINPGNHFDPLNDTYTVPSKGVYAINYEFRYGTGVQMELASFNGSTKVGILKQDSSGYSILDQRIFGGANVTLGTGLASLGTLGISISNTQINSLFSLEQGDVLSFEIYPGGISLGALGSSFTEVSIYKISD